MRCGLSVASFLCSALFPPQQRKAFHSAVLDEILQERVVSSRNRRNLRGVQRNYSMSGPPGAAVYRVSIKQEVNGLASTFLCNQVSVGDVLEVSAPRGNFTLRPGNGPVVLVSAGIGATPVLA